MGMIVKLWCQSHARGACREVRISRIELIIIELGAANNK